MNNAPSTAGSRFAMFHSVINLSDVARSRLWRFRDPSAARFK
jgi:hypothetical protein